MRYRALIIEPSKTFQGMIEQIMDSLGVEFAMFESGRDALEAAKQIYDFVLVSRTLKDINGEIFLKRFSMEHGLDKAITIMLTSENPYELAIEAHEAGFDYVFSKSEIENLQKFLKVILDSEILKVDANILVVEDSNSVAASIIDVFGKHHGAITHVRNFTEMQQAFEQDSFELVISDYYLENSDTGDDVIAEVRHHSNLEKASTPILVTSSEGSASKRTMVLRNGANDFMVKPYDNEELLIRSSNLIESHRVLKQSREQQQQLAKLALTDQLTELYNRHSLYDLGPKYVSNAQRHKTALSLLVIDLDHFKNINDTFGHSVGDKVLKAAARILKRACRTEDIVARFGGEEFVMLLSNCQLENAMAKAEQLRAALEASNPESVRVTASFGVSQATDDDSFDTLLERADRAVYRSKHGGRNQVNS